MSKVYLVSLGCDKNRVDGEVMIGTLRLAGYDVVNSPNDAEAIIINTCGFISDAVQESVSLIFELAEYKKAGKCRALVIVGCMAERYKAEIAEKIPEADAFIGVRDYDNIAKILTSLSVEPLANERGQGDSVPLQGQRPENFVRLLARSDSEIPHIAYVKVAEGCDNHCTYCTIPAIRGPFRSRPMEDIVAECTALVGAGARELVLVAQDTARYGTDIYGGKKLPELLREIAAHSGADWIRLMYVYPEQITPQLITAMSEIPQVCKYIDMPIQHSEDEILSAMGRRGGRTELERLIRVLRDRIPGIAIRTTLMVGFPGETEEIFEGLYDFAEEHRFDRLGVFPYSQEEGTKAAEMPDQIDMDTKQMRLGRLMELQQQIHFENQGDFVGKTLPVMVDSQDGGIYTGRTQYDTYESDCVVKFAADKKLLPGQIVNVKITAADGYDLSGELS